MIKALQQPVMPTPGSRRMNWYICGCPEGSRKEDELLTCPLHHVIFRRKCYHSSGTEHFVFNTDIDCIDCLGKSTLDNIVAARAEIADAESQVAQHHAELCKRVRMGSQEDEYTSSAIPKASYEHLINTQQEWIQERDRLIAVWPGRTAELIRDFIHYYGDWDETYWKDRKEEDEASKPYPDVPSVAWFAGDGDRDLFFERKPHATVYSTEEAMILKKITGRSFIQ